MVKEINNHKKKIKAKIKKIKITKKIKRRKNDKIILNLQINLF